MSKKSRRIWPCTSISSNSFYLNLVDWSSTNCLAVGLQNCVYLWSACTSRVTKLCDLTNDSSSRNNDCGGHIYVKSSQKCVLFLLSFWHQKCLKNRDIFWLFFGTFFGSFCWHFFGTFLGLFLGHFLTLFGTFFGHF